MSPFVFVVVAVGPCEYYAQTGPALLQLARKIGCDFHVVQHCRDAHLCRLQWMKLTMRSRFLDYERIIVADADILPNFANLTDDDFGSLTRSDKPMLAIDQGLPVSDSAFAAWVQRHLGPHAETRPALIQFGLHVPASGGCPESIRAIFEAWGKPPEDYFHDQNFINYWLQVNQIAVQVLPVAMNWMAPQFEEAILREAKIVHFAGAAKSLIAYYASLIPILRLDSVD